LRDKLITHGEKRETPTKTCNETMLRDKLRVFVSRISPPLALFALVTQRHENEGKDTMLLCLRCELPHLIINDVRGGGSYVDLHISPHHQSCVHGTCHRLLIWGEGRGGGNAGLWLMRSEGLFLVRFQREGCGLIVEV